MVGNYWFAAGMLVLFIIAAWALYDMLKKPGK
jgi:hypothetical protein